MPGAGEATVMGEYDEAVTSLNSEDDRDWRTEFKQLRSEIQRLELKIQEHDSLVARVVEALECLQNALLDDEPARACGSATLGK